MVTKEEEEEKKIKIVESLFTDCDCDISKSSYSSYKS
jgi:hypothetical protein